MSDALDHDALRELIPLHAIGALSGAERNAVESHLATCAECAEELRAFAPVGMALAQVAPQVDPPASLRAAILAAASQIPEERRMSKRAAAKVYSGSMVFVVPSSELNANPRRGSGCALSNGCHPVSKR